jgi:hypothetical protein
MPVATLVTEPEIVEIVSPAIRLRLNMLERC